jgi:hypothetical protein
LEDTMMTEQKIIHHPRQGWAAGACQATRKR